MNWNPWRQLMRDKVSLVKEDGRRYDDIVANVSSTSIMIDDVTLPVEEGDRILRRLPAGPEESYLVTDRGYHEVLYEIPSHYNIKVRKETSIPPESTGSTIYNLYGANPRVNIHSEDKSINVATVSPDSLFADLRRVLEATVEDPDRKSNLLALTDGLEQSRGTPDFTRRYQEFIASAADHLAILQPFIPALTQMLTGS